VDGGFLKGGGRGGPGGFTGEGDFATARTGAGRRGGGVGGEGYKITSIHFRCHANAPNDKSKVKKRSRDIVRNDSGTVKFAEAMTGEPINPEADTPRRHALAQIVPPEPIASPMSMLDMGDDVPWWTPSLQDRAR